MVPVGCIGGKKNSPMKLYTYYTYVQQAIAKKKKELRKTFIDEFCKKRLYFIFIIRQPPYLKNTHEK